VTDKCKKLRGGELLLCKEAEFAWSQGFIDHQTLRDHETRQTRERLALRKGKKSMALPCCPFCRANVDTAPKETP